MKFYNLIFTLFILIFINCCSDQTIYTGKIINKNIDISEINNKKMLISILGEPSYIDPLEKKFFYFSEKKLYKNQFSKKIEDRILLVFKFDELDNVTLVNKYNLDNEKDVKYIKETTPNSLVKRGLIERIFGGVGKETLPTSSQ